MLTDKDECSDPTVCLNGVCQNYRGGYQCSCNPGFVATENMTQCVGKNLVLIITSTKIWFHIAFKPRSNSQRYRFNILRKLRLLTLCGIKKSWHVCNILWMFVESRTLDCFTNLTRCCDMFKKSLTRLNFASPSSQLFCNLIEIVKADPPPDPLFPILLNMRKSSTSLLCVGRHYLCYFPQHILNIEQTFLRC